jgi:hypothetical protein
MSPLQGFGNRQTFIGRTPDAKSLSPLQGSSKLKLAMKNDPLYRHRLPNSSLAKLGWLLQVLHLRAEVYQQQNKKAVHKPTRYTEQTAGAAPVAATSGDSEGADRTCYEKQRPLCPKNGLKENENGR